MKKKQFVVYTAIIGKYDDINQPSVIDDRFDYILFTNDFSESRIGIWQIRQIGYHNDIQTKIARWVKTHPEELLPEYECSLWMDSNIDIKDTSVYDRVIKLFNKNTLIASMVHLNRHCIYDEMMIVLDSKLETENCILKWGHQLRKNNYPRNNGLYETNIVFRNHQHEKIKMVDEMWWKCIEHYSRRDQLSFNYVLYKTSTHCDFFISDKKNARNSNWFHMVEHRNCFKRILTDTFESSSLKTVVKYYNYKKQFNIYYAIYKLPFTTILAKLIGFYLRIYNAIYYRIKNKIRKS